MDLFDLFYLTLSFYLFCALCGMGMAIESYNNMSKWSK